MQTPKDAFKRRRPKNYSRNMKTYHQRNVPMQEENVYLKLLAVEEKIAITGDIMVRIPQKVDVTPF